MPTHYPRSEAVAAVASEIGEAPCLLCALRDRADLALPIIARGKHCRALLPRWVRRQGHVLVILEQHVTTLGEVSDEAWLEAQSLALAAGRALERAFAPARVYLAALGSTSGELPMTSAHLHVHAIPVLADDRPSDVLSWSAGAYRCSDDELKKLAEAISTRLSR